jgi:hypothetical protein
MITVRMREKDQLDFQVSFRRDRGEPISSESGVHRGCGSALAVAQEIAEIAISAQMDLQETDIIVGMVVYKHPVLKHAIQFLLNNSLTISVQCPGRFSEISAILIIDRNEWITNSSHLRALE